MFRGIRIIRINSEIQVKQNKEIIALLKQIAEQNKERKQQSLLKGLSDIQSSLTVRIAFPLLCHLVPFYLLAAFKKFFHLSVRNIQ